MDGLPASEAHNRPSVLHTSPDNRLKIIIGVLLVVIAGLSAALAYNYLKPTPKEQTTLVSTPAPTAPSAQGAFNPTLEPLFPQKGALVDNLSVLYTLQGRVTKIEPTGDKYNITLHSQNGSQFYLMKGLGGEGVLVDGSTRQPLPWSGLGEGDTVRVNLSMSTNNPDGPSKVTITQIMLLNKLPSP